QRTSPQPALPSRSPSARRSPDEAARLERAYALLLGALLLDNSLVPLYSHLSSGCPEGELAVLFRTLLELYEHDDSGAPIDASALMTALGDAPARTRVVALQTLAEEAESATILARDQARFIERTRAENALESLKRVALENPADPTAHDEQSLALERLHRELKNARVPTTKPAPVRTPRVPPT